MFFLISVGIVYQAITENGYVGPAAFTMGLFLGLSFGLIELFLPPKLALRVKKIPFMMLIVVKAIIYTLVVLLVSTILGFISGFIMGLRIEQFWQSLFNTQQFILIIMTLSCYTVIIIFLQIGRIMGKGKRDTSLQYPPKESFKLDIIHPYRHKVCTAKQNLNR